MLFNHNEVNFSLDNATYNKLHELVSEYKCNRNELLKIWIEETYNTLKNSEWVE